MSSSYPISSPVEFTNTSPDDSLIFNANGPATGPLANLIMNFVTTNPGDFLYRDPTGSRNALERLALGSVGNVLSVTGTNTPEVQDITTTAEAGSLNDTYFLIDCPTERFYVWYNVAGAGTDPALTVPLPTDLIVDGILRTGIVVAVAALDSATLVAVATAAAIDADPCFSVPVPGTPTMTVTMTDPGPVIPALDGSVPPNAGTFTYGETTPGTVALPGWNVPAPGSASETFLAEATAATASAVAAGSTWVTVDSSIITWNDSTLPNHDAGGIFTPATGIFAVPSTGIYSMSASIAFEGNSSGNGGGGISGRRAIRQARVRNTTTGATMTFGEIQAQASNLNPSLIKLVVANVSVTAADSLVIQVRHDANISLALSVDEDGLPTQGPSIHFSVSRTA